MHCRRNFEKSSSASVFRLVVLLLKDFVGLVVLANLIAIPLSYIASGNWLSRFAYRDSIGLGVFVVAFILIVLHCMITISSKSIKAALINPVKVLKDE